MVDIPSLDFTGVAAEDPVPHRLVERAVEAIRSAGVFRVVGCPEVESRVRESFAVAREFFEQSPSIKLRARLESDVPRGYSPLRRKPQESEHRAGGYGSLKEEFDVAAPGHGNVFPSEPERFGRVLERCYEEIEEIERRVYRVFSVALGEELGIELAPEHLERGKGLHRGLLRLNYYPRLAGEELGREQMRNGAHVDWTPFTVLFVERPGLEVFADGEWHAVPGTDGPMVLVGQQLEWWSNGRFAPCLHRVTTDGAEEGSRLSMAFFSTECVDVTDDRVVEPLCAEGEPARFEPFSIRDYLLGNFARQRLARQRPARQRPARPTGAVR